MIFNNATLLSLTKTSEFQSDTFRYKSTKNLTVEGLLLDLANDNGVKNILDNLKSFQQSLTTDWQDIIINGVNFAPNSRGIITSINFSEGDDVRTKTYIVDITIPEEGDSSTLGTNYTGLDFSKFIFIESFSESIEFTQTNSLDSYNQTINITLKAPPSLNSITEAKTVAENFFNSNSLNNVVGSYNSYNSTKKFFTESYDSISYECSFSRNFELYKGSNGLFSLKRTHQVSFDEQGIMSITESAEYVGNANSNTFQSANTQAISDINTSLTRCQNIFNSYKSPIDKNLCTTPVNKSWNADIFNNIISYEITYSNQLRMGTTFNAYHDFSRNITETEAGIYNFSYDGSIIGYGEYNTTNTKYTNASNSFQSIKSSLLTLPAPIGGQSFKEISRSETHSEIAGKIDYSIQYSTNDSLLNPQLNGIRRVNAVISRDYNRFLASNFNIIGFKEIVQIQKNKLENIFNYNITMNGKADTDIGVYVNRAKNIVSSNQPQSPAYLNDVNYSYDPFTRQFTFNATYFSLPS